MDHRSILKISASFTLAAGKPNTIFILALLLFSFVLNCFKVDNTNVRHPLQLQVHPWLTDSEREQLCRLMNCQKLSLEASTHAAQNERLPLRVIVQVLFFEQLRLRTSISGWFFVSENLDSSQNPTGRLGLPRAGGGAYQLDSAEETESVRERLKDLEKECSTIRKDLQKLTKTKKSWSIFPKRFGFRRKSECCNPKESNSCDVKTQPSNVNENPKNESS